jgi:hypothetical protein
MRPKKPGAGWGYCPTGGTSAVTQGDGLHIRDYVWVLSELLGDRVCAASKSRQTGISPHTARNLCSPALRAGPQIFASAPPPATPHAADKPPHTSRSRCSARCRWWAGLCALSSFDCVLFLGFCGACFYGAQQALRCLQRGRALRTRFITSPNERTSVPVVLYGRDDPARE